MPMARRWNGLELHARMDRAHARAIIGIGMEVTRETKILTHRISGSLARSVHIAPVGYEGADDDQRQAEGGEDLAFAFAHTKAEEAPYGGRMIEVGSWMPYACVEWVGRGHPGITQGLENARGTAWEYIAQAYREEGL